MKLTSSRHNDTLFSQQRERGDFCMKGGVYTKERCPVCGKNFKRFENDLMCPTHQTRPRKLYIQLYSRELSKYINLFSDSRGIPFSSYEQAYRILTKIRAEIDARVFDPSRYVTQKLKPLQFNNWSTRWLQNKETEAEKKIISPSYLKELRRFISTFQNFFNQTDIRDIGTRQVIDFYLSLKGSPKYIINILSCLHKMLSDALDWGDIGKMPKFPKIQAPEPDFKTIDLDQQDAVVQKINEPMDRAYILFTAREMVRPSETRALCWDDLDFKHDRVVIRRHFSLNELRETTKTKRIKVLPLDGDVKDSLLRLPRHITSPFVF